MMRFMEFIMNAAIVQSRAGEDLQFEPESLSSAASVCRHDVISIHEDLDAASAARLMRDRHLTCLVVTDPQSRSVHHVVGILSDFDVVSAVVAREADPRSLRAGDLMTRPALLIGADEPFDSLLKLMHDARVHRAPVVGAKGELVGMLWLEDVLEHIVQQRR
jgi:CBS domain-containing protein